MGIKTDRELTSLLREGNIEAFDILYYRYQSKVYNFAQRLLVSRDDAEGIVQEVFCAVWKNRMDIDPEQKFSAYLYGIARNQVHTIMRRRTLFWHYLKILERGPGPNLHYSENHIDEVDIKELIVLEIEMMPPRRKEIFRMSRFDELTYQQIAEKLSVSENTVDTHIRLALKHLRNVIKINYFFL